MGLITVLVVHMKAQNFSFGPQLGYSKTQDADKGSFMGGIAWRLKLMPAPGAEASINYRQDKHEDGVLTFRSRLIMVTGFIYPIPVIYGGIGFGWYYTTFDYDQSKLPSIEDETTQKAGWHLVPAWNYLPVQNSN